MEPKIKAKGAGNLDHEEQAKWAWLRSELQAAMNASEADYVALDSEEIIKEARARRDARSR